MKTPNNVVFLYAGPAQLKISQMAHCRCCAKPLLGLFTNEARWFCAELGGELNPEWAEYLADRRAAVPRHQRPKKFKQYPRRPSPPNSAFLTRQAG